MIIEVKRLWPKDGYTIGKLFINNKFVCNTLEDADRGLYQAMTLDKIKAKKVYGETAIPTGRYKVIITKSTKFGRDLPLLLNVPGYDGIRIHAGNTPKDTLGCILLGKNDKVGQVSNSRHWSYEVVQPMIEKAIKNGEEVSIIITRKI